MEQAAKPFSPLAVRPRPESGWDAFVDWYGRAILDWFRQTKLNQSEADNLVRGLMQHFAREFAKVSSEPSLRFRAWLQYAAHAAWCKLMDEWMSKNDKERASPIVAFLLSVDAHDEFLKAIDAECFSQRRREVLPIVQTRADTADWEAFYLVVLDGQTVQDAAEQMECSEIAVYASMRRVDKMLQQELQKLEENC